MLKKKTYSLAELAQLLNADYDGDPECTVSSLGPLETAKPGEISFLNNSRFRQHLASTQASIVILSQSDTKYCKTNALIMDNPHLGYAKIAELFNYSPPHLAGKEASAQIADNCHLDSTAYIGPHCVIGPDVTIGKATQIGANCVIGEGVVIGNHCIIHPNVTIYHHVTLDDHVVVHSGAVIGSDGFGNVKDEQGNWQTIPQLGTVKIGNHVNIGANTTIDRGSLKDTVIEDYVRLDNLIQIAHNVTIGNNTAIAACTGIAGSTTIGANCMIGGGSRIADNLTIADNVILTGATTVPQSIKHAGIYGSGVPLLGYKELIKNASRYRQLDDIAKRLARLEKHCDEPT